METQDRGGGGNCARCDSDTVSLVKVVDQSSL